MYALQVAPADAVVAMAQEGVRLSHADREFVGDLLAGEESGAAWAPHLRVAMRVPYATTFAE